MAKMIVNYVFGAVLALVVLFIAGGAINALDLVVLRRRRDYLWLPLLGLVNLGPPVSILMLAWHLTEPPLRFFVLLVLLIVLAFAWPSACLAIRRRFREKRGS
jgi:hypothetical protein